MKAFWTRVLLTTLVVGTADLIAAYIDQFVKTGKFADKMLYYIAGGGIGLETSMQGGFWIGLLGLLFHYFIAFSFTLLFFLVYPRLKLQYLSRPTLYILGFLYGPFIGLFMKFIVLPLTRLPQSPFVFQKAIIGWIILSIAIGIPVAISARAYYAKRQIQRG
jgi:hypothetical protein